MIGIYRITNKITNKHYIGQSVNIQRRFAEHCRRNEQVIDKAIQQYGIDNFEFVVLEECEPKDLNQKEDLWISHYNSIVPNGYNMGYCYNCISGEVNGNSKLTTDDVIFMRNIFNSKTYTSVSKVWEKYFKEKISLSQFRAIFSGEYGSHIMPEVFTDENIMYYDNPERGSGMYNQNGKDNFASIVSEEDAIQIRALYTTKERKEIFKLFPQYSERTVTAIISGQNGKHIPIYKKRQKIWIGPKDYNENDKINWLERIKIICHK